MQAEDVHGSYEKCYDGYGQTDVANDVGMKNSAFHFLSNGLLERFSTSNNNYQLLAEISLECQRGSNKSKEAVQCLHA